MFTKALPVWLKGLDKEMNIQAEYTAEFKKAPDTVLRIAGATYYRVYINGILLHYGPARCAGGYARVDVVEIPQSMLSENNKIVIQAVNYYCNSFASVMQAGFIVAEIVSGESCLAATGYDFKGYRASARLQKVMRYSSQRQFSEVWDMNIPAEEYELCRPDTDIKYLPRRAPMPDLTENVFDNAQCVGSFTYCEPERPHKKQGFIDMISPTCLGFPLEEVVERPVHVFDQMDYEITENPVSLSGLRLEKGKFAFINCKVNYSGMIRVKFSAKENSKIFIVFDERLIDNKFSYANWALNNVIQVSGKGDIDFTSFEVYGFRFAAIYAVEGDVTLESFSIINYKNPIKNPPALNCDDAELQGIYSAAVETLRQNAVDIYTDCPTRERAGWLCDSYYSAMAEYAFTGGTAVEDDFVENYLLQESPDVPKGMLPMCYPGNQFNKNFIPQWAMWFVLEMEGYIKRNPGFDKNRFKKVAYDLLDFFRPFENEYTLLEDLPKWNFVEWSKANDWVKGVNFPTNMLYSRILCIIGDMFGDASLNEKAQKIRKSVIELSYNGTFFRDQAERDENGKLVVHPDRITEVCQYYAFRFGCLKSEDFPELYKILTTDFYPNTEKYPDIPKVNAFIGMYVRMELLYEWGLEEKLIDEIKAFFGHMAQYTGTLWEHKEIDRGSLNHGFASYVGALLLEIYNKK